jgi:HEAT repeat protein
VRAGACATIRTFLVAQGGESAGRLLDDPSAEVRGAAIYAVMALDPRRWADEVLRRLRDDPDEDVAKSAFFKLKEAKALSRPELLRIVEQSPWGSLRYLAAYEIKWTAEDLDLLIRMLSDPNAQVRLYGVGGLRKIKARRALGQVIDRLAREDDENVIGSSLHMLGELGDSSAVPILLEWTRSPDDFHRLEAIEALARIGDDRAIPVAQAMLREDRPPVRHDAHGLMRQSHVQTIGQLVRKSLGESSSPAIRKLTR